jgi:hypothetical protein
MASAGEGCDVASTARGPTHRLCRGGEQWIAFAQTQLARLRALSIYACSKTFIMPDGATVRVKIVGEQEFIWTEGGGALLSGVVRDGELIEVPATPPATTPTKSLRDFLATADCAKHTAKGVSSKKFTDCAVLATPLDPSFGYTGPDKDTTCQTHFLCPSMYSGRMQKAVQILLGKIDPKTKVTVPLLYNYRWDCTHIITKSDKGKDYLVEISKKRGVLAMALPVSAAQGSDNVSSAAKKEFSGVPTGETFPVDDVKLAAAIKSGSVARLLTADAMKEFYGEDHFPFSTAHGWTTNKRGDEAHSVRFEANDKPHFWGAHYKLTLPLVSRRPDSPPGTPCVSGTPVLTQVERDKVLCEQADPLCRNSVYRNPYPIFAWEPEKDALLHTKVEPCNEYRHTPVVVSAPVFVFVDAADNFQILLFRWSNLWWADAGTSSSSTTLLEFPAGQSTEHFVWNVASSSSASTGEMERANTPDPHIAVAGQTPDYADPYAYALNNVSDERSYTGAVRWSKEVTIGISTFPPEAYSVCLAAHRLSHTATRRFTAFIPRGMRNGWVRVELIDRWRSQDDYVAGPTDIGVDLYLSWGDSAYAITPADAPGKVGTLKMGETASWVESFTYPESDVSSTFSRAVTHVEQSATLTWFPSGEVTHLPPQGEADFYYIIQNVTLKLKDDTDVEMIWCADSTGTNHVRSKDARKVEGKGVLVSDQPDKPNVGKVYSFVGYTGDPF